MDHMYIKIDVVWTRQDAGNTGPGPAPPTPAAKRRLRKKRAAQVRRDAATAPPPPHTCLMSSEEKGSRQREERGTGQRGGRGGAPSPRATVSAEPLQKKAAGECEMRSVQRKQTTAPGVIVETREISLEAKTPSVDKTGRGRDEVDRSAPTPAPPGDAARERVRAEREAKKLAKQVAKQRAVAPAPAASTHSESTHAVSTHTVSTHADSTIAQRRPPTIIKQEMSEASKVAVRAKVEREAALGTTPSAGRTPARAQEKVDKDEVDRSAPTPAPPGDAARERVRAEREAKKLAKQVAKQRAAAPAPAASTHAESTHAESTHAVSTHAVSTHAASTHTVSTHAESTHAQPQRPEVAPQESARSKAEVRAERRARQDAQRAAKLVAAPPPPPSTVSQETKATVSRARDAVKRAGAGAGATSAHRVNWFQHLHGASGPAGAALHIPINSKELHPAVVRLGVQLSSRIIVGSNARCVALLNTLKQVVTDYSLPARTEFARGLEAQLATSLTFVWKARPAAASMTNAVKHLRWQLTQLPNNISEFDAKCRINDAIDTYIRDQIEVAGEAISIAVRNKISNGDNILTYGCSSLVEKILKEAWSAGLQFRAVVVGSRARPEARELLRRLVAHGVPAAYINISALSFVMRTIDKVVVGAGSLLGNGWVMAHAGTAQVALVARAFNVPVLVCCETHKFSERVQTDAFVYNELGEPERLVETEESACPLRAWRSLPALTPLDLTYDVTPPTLVTAVVTELAVLPCTSAPVVLRFKLSEYGL